MSKVVRSSKFRHVFGQPAKPEKCYNNINLSKNAWDSNYASVNPNYLALCYHTGGGGAAGVVPLGTTGKLDGKVFLFDGHSGPVLDVEFNPFNDNILATASDDTTVKIWQIPQGGLTSNVSDAVQVLKGHGRKVGSVNFNPVADNVLATSGIDYKVKGWDIEKGEELFSIEGHSAIIQSVQWNWDGTQIVTFCKDKKLRLIDPRSNSVVAEAEAHLGTKGGKATFLGTKGKIFSAGFGKTSERELAIFDIGNLSAPLVQQGVDNGSGLLTPFFDDSTGVLFLSGKGDGNIRFYEIADDNKVIYPLSQHSSTVPQQGVCAMPKRGVDVNTNEIMRLYKCMANTVEPISFLVPRKSDVFQDDLFPDAPSGEPALTADEWKSGKTASPVLRSMAPGYVEKEKKNDFKPVVKEEVQLSASELASENEKLKARIAYLESELAKLKGK